MRLRGRGLLAGERERESLRVRQQRRVQQPASGGDRVRLPYTLP